MKKLLTLVLLFTALSAQAGIRSANKAYRQTEDFLINDVDNDIRYWQNLGYFGFRYNLRVGTPDAIGNDIVNELIRKGYTVFVDFPQDSDGNTSMLITISWDKPEAVRK